MGSCDRAERPPREYMSLSPCAFCSQAGKGQPYILCVAREHQGLYKGGHKQPETSLLFMTDSLRHPSLPPLVWQCACGRHGLWPGWASPKSREACLLGSTKRSYLFCTFPGLEKGLSRANLNSQLNFCMTALPAALERCSEQDSLFLLSAAAQGGSWVILELCGAQ